MDLKKELFKPLLNTNFTITFDAENKYDVKLIEIKEHDVISSLNLEPFTLTFRGDKNEIIFAQRTYDVHSEATGHMSLFLIPRRPDDDGIYYDVILQ